MKYPLSSFEFVSTQEVEKLEALGILNTDDLMNHGAKPKDREILAEQTGIELERIELLVSVSDLVRIKGVGKKYAFLFAKYGNIKSVQGLVNRTGEQHTGDKEKALIKFIDQIKSNSTSDRTPTKNELLEIVEEAIELKPRIEISKNPVKWKIEKEFTNKLEEIIRNKYSFESKSTFYIFGLLSLASLIGIAFTYYPIYFNYKRTNDFLTATLNVKMNFVLSAFWLQIFDLLGHVLIILLFIMLFLMLWQVSSKYQIRFCYKNFFRSTPTKKAFLEYDYLNITKRFKRNGWILMLLSLTFVAVIIISVMKYGFDKGIEIFKYASGIFLLLLLVVLYTLEWKHYNSVKYISLALKELNKRIQLASHINVLYSIIILIVALNFIIPLSLKTSVLYNENVIHSLAKSKKDKVLAELKTLEGRNYDQDVISNLNIILSQYYLERLKSPVHGKYKLNTFFTGFDNVQMSIMWVLLVGLALSFSIPYFHFSGFKTGITFLVIILFSIGVNVIVEKNFPNWFLVENSPVMRFLFIFVFTFWFAILFDWLYNIITFKKVECPNCNNLVEKHYKFCPYCGLVKAE